MSEKQLYDISEVCRLLDTTSRTLRFYEEKGIIQSTQSKFSSRRQYTAEQINDIRHVIVLRTLGLSIKVIAELERNNTDLKNAVISRRAEMMAIIDEKYRQIRILNEALCMINEGESIFECSPNQSVDQVSAELEDIVQKCTEGVIQNDPSVLYSYLSEQMKDYMPISAYENCRQDTLAPLGVFVTFDRIERDSKDPNTLYHYIKYEKLGLKIKYVFHHRLIHGFWMGYYLLN